MPSDSAASIIPREICVSPTCVLRTIGSSAYSVSAMNAGTTPMRPVSGIRTASRASDGIVWMTPVAPRIQRRSRPAPRGEHAQRDADRTTRRQAQEHESEMFQRQATEVGREQSCQASVGSPTRTSLLAPAPAARSASPRRWRQSPCLRVRRPRSGVASPRHRADLRAARAPPKPLANRCGTSARYRQHRVVAREVPEVVVEHGQRTVDLGVGRVDVDHVDLAAGDRFVREPVVEAARRAKRQPVGALQIRANRRRGRETPATARVAARGAA